VGNRWWKRERKEELKETRFFLPQARLLFFLRFGRWNIKDSIVN
jgi:hypothetical protein